MHARNCSWAMVPLRLILGFGMMYHGYPKLFTAAGHQQFVGMLDGIGVPLPELTAWGIGALEVVGGMLLVLGALTRLLSALFIVEMLVAAVLVHLPSGFNAINITGMTESGPTFGMPGWEVNALYAAGFLTLLIAGAGAYSIDAGMAGGAASRAAGHPPARGWRERRAPRWRDRARSRPAP